MFELYVSTGQLLYLAAVQLFLSYTLCQQFCMIFVKFFCLEMGVFWSTNYIKMFYKDKFIILLQEKPFVWDATSKTYFYRHQGIKSFHRHFKISNKFLWIFSVITISHFKLSHCWLCIKLWMHPISSLSILLNSNIGAIIFS